MAKIKKAEEELYSLLADVYLFSTKSVGECDKIVVPIISNQHPFEMLEQMTERIRRIIKYLS